MKCSTCSRGFSRSTKKSQCVKCQKVFHVSPDCLLTSMDDYFKHQSTWTCHVCVGLKQASAERSKTFDLATDKNQTAGSEWKSATEVTMNEVFLELVSFRNEVKKTHVDMECSIQRFAESLAESKKKIDFIELKLTQLFGDVEQIKQDNGSIKSELSGVANKVDVLEQAVKDKSVEIYGVPFVDGENIVTILDNISTCIGFGFEPSMIDNCYRYKSADNKKCGGVAVRFLRKLDMENFVMCGRKRRDLNTRDLGFTKSGATPVYINYSLTQAKRKLLNTAKIVKKSKKYMFLWIKSGNIYMRKCPEDKCVPISCEYDLEQLP